ncbi:hypothetical protein [Kocuria arenosa]|uniref:hypothetical protein n=1 Tax=Kocuria arenosa TaxID=3071446 RepID=UPI0034D6D967
MVLEQRQEFTEPPPNRGRFTGIGNGTHVGSLAWSTITDYRIDDISFEILPA